MELSSSQKSCNTQINTPIMKIPIYSKHSYEYSNKQTNF